MISVVSSRNHCHSQDNMYERQRKRITHQNDELNLEGVLYRFEKILPLNHCPLRAPSLVPANHLVKAQVKNMFNLCMEIILEV